MSASVRTRVPSKRRKSKQVEGSIKGSRCGRPTAKPNPRLFAELLESGDYTQKEAMRLAGYSEKTNGTTIARSTRVLTYRQNIREQRDKLNRRKGYRLEDNAKWLKDMSENDQMIEPRVRLEARKHFSKILGHEAPVEVEQRTEGGAGEALLQMMSMIKAMKVTPLELLQKLDQQPSREIPFTGSITDGEVQEEEGET